MRPGQLEPNEFERAILERLARQNRSLGGSVERLRVLSREFTGVGSFTTFQCDESGARSHEQRFGLDGLIRMPGVPNGMGAVLLCRGDQPRWDGVYDGFLIE